MNNKDMWEYIRHFGPVTLSDVFYEYSSTTRGAVIAALKELANTGLIECTDGRRIVAKESAVEK